MWPTVPTRRHPVPSCSLQGDPLIRCSPPSAWTQRRTCRPGQVHRRTRRGVCPPSRLRQLPQRCPRLVRQPLRLRRRWRYMEALPRGHQPAAHRLLIAELLLARRAPLRRTGGTVINGRRRMANDCWRQPGCPVAGSMCPISRPVRCVESGCSWVVELEVRATRVRARARRRRGRGTRTDR